MILYLTLWLLNISQAETNSNSFFECVQSLKIERQKILKFPSEIFELDRKLHWMLEQIPYAEENYKNLLNRKISKEESHIVQNATEFCTHLKTKINQHVSSLYRLIILAGLSLLFGFFYLFLELKTRNKKAFDI